MKVPAKSEAQRRLMEGVAHDPKFAEKVGIPQKVGKEFVGADRETVKKIVMDRIKSRKV